MEIKTLMDMVRDDIDTCDLVSNNEKMNKEIFNEMVGKYSKVSSNFPEIETNPLWLRNHPEYYKDAIKMIQGFLNAYLLNGCTDYNIQSIQSPQINITNTLTNQNNISISSFTETKEKIEKMSSLTEEEILEILEKLNQLEKIVNSSDRKSKKWSNAKGIIKWVADKSVDVGTALLPLILKIGQ